VLRQLFLSEGRVGRLQERQLSSDILKARKKAWEKWEPPQLAKLTSGEARKKNKKKKKRSIPFQVKNLKSPERNASQSEKQKKKRKKEESKKTRNRATQPRTQILQRKKRGKKEDAEGKAQSALSRFSVSDGNPKRKHSQNTERESVVIERQLVIVSPREQGSTRGGVFWTLRLLIREKLVVNIHQNPEGSGKKREVLPSSRLETS